jgi:hybrid cluster-associated redox disulfide protein
MKVESVVAVSDLERITDLTVEAALTRWPQTAEVFNRHNMACVGCPVAPFYTVAEAAAVYRLPLDAFLQELEDAINHDR